MPGTPPLTLTPHAIEGDRHANPGWLAASGIACLFGRHWPTAALSATGGGHRRCRCADCGRPMERMADGRWRTVSPAVWRGAGAIGSR